MPHTDTAESATHAAADKKTGNPPNQKTQPYSPGKKDDMLEAMGLTIVLLLALTLLAAIALIATRKENKNHSSNRPIKIEVVGESQYRPARAHHDDAGWDIRTAEDVFLRPGERALVPTGIKLGIPAGFCVYVLPRSGSAHKLGVTVNNSPGLIDAGYQGMVYVNVINHGQKAVRLNKGNRIAQLVVQPVTPATMAPVKALTGSTERGTKGHGSTGEK